MDFNIFLIKKKSNFANRGFYVLNILFKTNARFLFHTRLKNLFEIY